MSNSRGGTGKADVEIDIPQKNSFASPRARKGELLLSILSAAAETAVNTAAFFEVFLKTRYGDSPDFRRRTNAKMAELDNLKINKEFERQEKRRFASFIYKLKKDGLLMDAGGEGGKILEITSLGRAKLAKTASKESLPKVNQYRTEEGGIFTLVIFDIPEDERRKREWIRRALAELGLTMVQKSVWLGKVRIPKQFIADLNELKILNFVQILEITKAGTLRSVGN